MTQPKDLTSTKADLDRSPRTKKLLQAKEVLKKRHRKIRPQSDLRSIERIIDKVRILRIEQILEERFGLDLSIPEPPPPGPTVDQIVELYQEFGFSYQNARRQARRDAYLGWSLAVIRAEIEDRRKKALRTIYKTNKPG